MQRSTRPDVRNPLLSLPAASRLFNIPAVSRDALRELLLDLRRDAQAKAEKCWRQHKAPMAAYWKAAAVYCGHIARLLRVPAGPLDEKVLARMAPHEILEELSHRGHCPSLLNDDDGHWRVSGCGCQPLGGGEGDYAHFAHPEDRWYDTITEAVQAYLAEIEDITKPDPEAATTGLSV